MATTPTQNSVPSESPRDLKFNAGKIDEFVTSLVNTYVDRFGNEHYTIEGLRWLAQQAIAQYGWILIDSFQDGADITLPNQALRDEDTGEYYRWDGALPKHVDAGSTPSSSGGVGVGAWVGIGDASLRAMLATSAGAGMIGALDSDGNATTVQGAIGHYRAYTVKERLDEEISVASIAGVDPTGATDSTAALQDFFDTLPNGSEVYFPAGTYKITGLVIKNHSLKIRGAYRYPYGQSTTKIKAGADNITLMKFTGNGCRIEGLLFEGFEANATTNGFGKGTTCKGLNFEPATGTLADIDATVDDCIFWYFQTGIEGHGRNLTVTYTGFTFCRFCVDLYGVVSEQFRGHVLNNNRFHSCGGTEAATNSTILNSVCIRLTTPNTNNVDNYAGNISILNNVCDGGCYQFFKGPFHRGSIMADNNMFRVGGAGAIVIDVDNTSTSGNTSADGALISDNIMGGFDLPVYQNGVQYCPDMGIRLTQVRGAILSENLINKVWKDGIKLVSCSEIVITAEVKDPSAIVNQSTATLYSSVDIDAGCANIMIPHLMTRCVLAGSQLAAYVKTACASTVIGELYGSASYTAAGPVVETGSGYTVGDVSAVSSKTKRTAITGLITGSNYPVGNYKPGDVCKYLNPAVTGYKEAVCTVGGNGSAVTWKNSGALV
ncbi:glycosyl hydrolase family 28-related protein [Enterobacter cloacae]|uniref:tail fiber/spike domain-containing protein n=2 Tax=Enterobacter cloacae TaxID=550 RepID=UPI001FF51B33|nr:glycosyl hydrolase family 28-related protein [Enterobacter cloacae]MCJ8538511.1 hypothetical protein [Enterobacter cloacae]MCQ4409429.1 hypothetical protein [Enterobacter cloacae]HDC4334613.1 hypothetical protein [Enterobacter cloacae]HDC4357481.1 hypothetical protein [Enterobacter cloacae]HDC4472316.1 hypothetical protein [Enterobacter cloacae]